MSAELNELGQRVGAWVAGWPGAQPPSTEPLTGRYCRVVRLDPEAHTTDLHAANQLDGTGANWTYLPYGPFVSCAAYGAWLRDVASWSDPLFFAVIEASTNRATGVASLLRISPEHGSIEVGHINFSPRLQRTTAATEAMYLMMARVFDAWGYRRYEWKCNALNEASMRAARRLGFTYEGTHRQAQVVKGRNRDTAWFSITDDEWPGVQRRLLAWLDPSNFDASGAQRRPLQDVGRAP